MGKTKLGDDGWSVSRITPQSAEKMTLEAMHDAANETKNHKCAHVRDETVDGIAAAVYDEHVETEDGKSDAEIWISKAQGLIVRHEAKSDGFTMTIRYVYTDVQAPANAKGPVQ
jgi:hypothetical protein